MATRIASWRLPILMVAVLFASCGQPASLTPATSISATQAFLPTEFPASHATSTHLPTPTLIPIPSTTPGNLSGDIQDLQSIGMSFTPLSPADPQASGIISQEEAVSASIQAMSRLAHVTAYSPQIGFLTSSSVITLAPERLVWLVTKVFFCSYLFQGDDTG